MSFFLCNFAAILGYYVSVRQNQYEKEDRIMATAIKAIPTLYGEEALRFLTAAQAAERRYDERGPIDWSQTQGVQTARQIWANMMQ